MRKWLILLSVLSLSAAASAAPAWTWVDENGQVHYSDRPVAGARQIELSGAQGFSAPRVGSRAPTSSGAEAASASTYQTLRVAGPAPDETLWNIGGSLSVQIEVAPRLQAGHRIDIVFDGQRQNLNTTSQELTVPNVVRGTHSLQAVIVDARGQVLMSSPAVSIVVQQTSIQNPNNPNSPRARANRAAPRGN